MSKLRPIFVIIPGVLLVIIVVCVFAFVLLPPVNKEITKVAGDRDTEKAKAEERPAAERRLEDAEANLEEQQAKLDQYMATRSIPFSTYQPVQAMIALWFELQEDLAPAIEEFIEGSGCRIVQGAALPAPRMEKPVLGPSNFLAIPASGSLRFGVQGTMEEIRTLYNSLSTFKRVATISSLDVRPASGDELQASFNLNVFLLAEGPEGGGAAAPAAGAGPEMPGMVPGMMPGGPMPGGPMPGGPMPSGEMPSGEMPSGMDEGVDAET